MLKQIGVFLVVLASACGADSYDTLAVSSTPEIAGPLAQCLDYSGRGCYWMENTSGNYCWVPATWASSFEACRALDSCNGGGGQSGGGCYKWADCSNCQGSPW